MNTYVELLQRLDFVASGLRSFSEAWLPVLLDAAAKGLVLLAVGGALVLAMRKASAAARQTVWLLALAALIALPIASAALPSWAILPGWVKIEIAEPAEPAAAGGTDSAAALALATPPAPLRGAEQADAHAIVPPGDYTPSGPSVAIEPAQQAGRDTISPAVTTAKPSGPADTWRSWVIPSAVAAWLAGAFVCLLPLVLGRISLHRLARRSRRIGISLAASKRPGTAERSGDGSPDGWAELLRRAAQAVGLRRPITLLQSSDETMPMVWGVLRPKLLMPAEAEDWTLQRRWVVLLHELAHARRRDCLAKLIAHVACSLYWFNPLCWVAFKLMQREAETACDDLVLMECGGRALSLAKGGAAAFPAERRSQSGVDATALQEIRPSDYAQHLLEIATGLPRRSCAKPGPDNDSSVTSRPSGMLAARLPRACRGASSIAMARRSKLEGRLLAILDATRNRQALTRIGILVAAALACSMAMTLAIAKAPSDLHGEMGGIAKAESVVYFNRIDSDLFYLVYLNQIPDRSPRIIYKGYLKTRDGTITIDSQEFKLSRGSVFLYEKQAGGISQLPIHPERLKMSDREGVVQEADRIAALPDVKAFLAGSPRPATQPVGAEVATTQVAEAALVLHIVSKAEWQNAAAVGVYRPESLKSAGFVHCSTPEQIIRVANDNFRGTTGLVLLCIDPHQLKAPLKYENLEGGTSLFPHIYGPLNLDAVVEVLDFAPQADGTFLLPGAVADIGERSRTAASAAMREVSSAQSQTTPASQPATQSAAMSWGQVETRTLSAMSQDWALDLDTGKTNGMPAQGTNNEDIDVIPDQTQPGDKPPGLLGLHGLKGIIVEQNQWDANAADVAAKLSQEDLPILKEMPARTLPATYWVKTNTDGLARLQIVEVARVENRQGLKVRYSLLVSGPSTKPAGEWGKANNGVQARLRADKHTWAAGQTPTFRADIRNQGEGTYTVAQAQQLCEIEVDGGRYIHIGDMDVKSSALPPGEAYTDIHIALTDNTWFVAQPVRVGRSVPIINGIMQKLSLAPGRHTLRVIFFADGVGGGQKNVVVESNAVEFEIAAPGVRVSEMTFFELSCLGKGRPVRIKTNLREPGDTRYAEGFVAINNGPTNNGGLVFTGIIDPRGLRDDSVLLVASADLLNTPLAEIPAGKKASIPRAAIVQIDEIVPATQPASSKLEFRIVPNDVGSSRQPVLPLFLGEGTQKKYVPDALKELAEYGPDLARQRQDEFQWFELAGNVTFPDAVIG